MQADLVESPSATQRKEALVSCYCYALSSIAISLVNKAMFSDRSFDFPLSILASQAFGTVACLAVAGLLRPRERQQLDGGLACAMAPVTLFFVAMLWTSSRALRHCSIPVISLFKNLSVALITAYEWAMYSQPISCGILIAVLCMMVGSFVAAAGDLQFSVFGYSWLGINVLCTVAHVAGVRAWLNPRAATTASKTLHNQLIAFTLFLAGAAGEPAARPGPGPNQSTPPHPTQAQTTPQCITFQSTQDPNPTQSHPIYQTQPSQAPLNPAHPIPTQPSPAPSNPIQSNPVLSNPTQPNRQPSLASANATQRHTM